MTNQHVNSTDLIAAIATAYGSGAIGIVRISGSGAGDFLRKIFKPAGTQVKNFKSHNMYYGHIVDDGQVIDEVMICPMIAPRTFTGEDTVEIYAHGGIHVLDKVLGTVITQGARLAQPGEFTKRAFLNGRINLTQAEAVIDLINASTDTMRRASLKQLGGGLSGQITEIRNQLLGWIAHIELSIDYPEHEDEAKNMAQILDEGQGVIAKLTQLCNTADIGRILQEGVKTAIVGRPNAGKSTLLNAILKEDRAIVHHTAGTTRDVLTEKVHLGQIPLILMDTAGIRNTNDPIEKIGVEKSRNAMEDAELVLYMIDSTQGIAPEDEENLRAIAHKEVILLANKYDLADAQDIPGTINISTKTAQGLPALYQAIEEKFLQGLDSTGDAEIITRQRHKQLLAQAAGDITSALQAIEMGMPEDLVSIHLRGAYTSLGEILGLEVSDDILDRIFAEFCLGK